MNNKNLIKEFLKYLLDIPFFNGEQFKSKNDILINTLRFFAKNKRYDMFKLLIKLYKCRQCFKVVNSKNGVWRIDLPVIIESDITTLRCFSCSEVLKRLKNQDRLRHMFSFEKEKNSDWVIVISQNPNPTNPNYDTAEYRYKIGTNKFQIGTVFGLGHFLFDLSTTSLLPPVIGLLICLDLWPRYNLYFTDTIKCSFTEIKTNKYDFEKCWTNFLQKEINIIKKLGDIKYIILLGDIAQINIGRITNMGFTNNVICLYHPQGRGLKLHYKNPIRKYKKNNKISSKIIKLQNELAKLGKTIDDIDGFWNLTI
jgi:hypothetical protein